MGLICKRCKTKIHGLVDALRHREVCAEKLVLVLKLAERAGFSTYKDKIFESDEEHVDITEKITDLVRLVLEHSKGSVSKVITDKDPSSW